MNCQICNKFNEIDDCSICGFCKEDKIQKLGNNILDKQREVDKLLNDLYGLDETEHENICEFLREGGY